MNQQAKLYLKQLAEANGGRLEARDVVNDARREDSPLHSYFTWDDSVAAERYRLQQARQLIRVTVEYFGSPENAIKSRTFVSLTTDRHKGGNGYRLSVDVLSDSQMRAQLLADAFRQMAEFRKKYKHLEELAEVLRAMQEALEKTAA